MRFVFWVWGVYLEVRGGRIRIRRDDIVYVTRLVFLVEEVRSGGF